MFGEKKENLYCLIKRIEDLQVSTLIASERSPVQNHVYYM